MKSLALLALILFIFLNGTYSQSLNYPDTKNMGQIKTLDEVRDFAATIQWLGQATARIKYKGHVIYIDPFQLKLSDTADLILITHDHFDHLSPDDIARIASPNTRFVVAATCKDKLEKAGYRNIQAVTPGSKLTILGLGITAVPAYKLTSNKHPKDSNYVGFLIDFDGIVLYHTGDTERIPEMKDIRCDIIMLPLGQTYTMNSVEEAAGAVTDTKARIAMPIHWGLYEGTAKDAEKFSQLMREQNILVVTGK